MSRLSALDASFLRVETPTAHMHVGWFSTLELPRGVAALDAGALVQRIAARLHLAPRFRQRLVETPLALGEPRWHDDDAFSIERHVEVAGQPVRDERGLRELTDAFLSRQLRRDRPLWSLLVVPRAGPGQGALVGKVHHAMVDGIAAVELAALLFDAEADAPAGEPPQWRAAPVSGPVRLVLDAVADGAVDQLRTARRVAALGPSPGQGMRIAGSVRRAAFSLAEDVMAPAPPSALNVPIGAERTLIKHRVALQKLDRVKRHHGATLNDVVLAVAAGALRRLAMALGEEPVDLRTMVPISVRGQDDASGQGNRITFAFMQLPVADADPADRLRRVQEQMSAVKDAGRIAGSELLMRSVGTLPEPLKRRVARAAASPRLYNLTVSNVPGPRVPLYAAGAKVRSIYPVIPIPDGHALSIGVLTYEGSVHFAVYADPTAVPRLHRLPAMLDDAVEELALEPRRAHRRRLARSRDARARVA